MFHLESEMAPRVTRWLTKAGLQVKSEFVTPWGICDLVGLSFNSCRVNHRVQLRQTKPLSSITRAALLLQVPDVETRKSISVDHLTGMFASAICESSIASEIERLIADGFLVRSRRDRLQKLNGWMPLHDRLVAVELKLDRIEEAMQQAQANLGFADESYVAFPMAVARQVAHAPSRWSGYIDEGIGVLGVLPTRCEVLVSHSPSTRWRDQAIQLYCVEKFWRNRGLTKGSSA